MANPANPLNALHDKLWELIAAALDGTHGVALAKIEAGNQIKFNDPENRDTIKQNIITGDTPELMLVPTNAEIRLFNTSSTTKVVQRYSLIVNTGDYRLNYLCNVLNWALLCNLTTWKTTLGALTWKAEHYVKRVDVVTIDIGESNPERNRGVKGFVAVWACEFEMHFSTVNLTQTE